MPIAIDKGNFALCKVDFMIDGKPGRHAAITIAGFGLLQELRRVGWDLPDLDVKLRTYGSGTNVMCVVASVSGSTEAGPFRIRFGSPTGQRGRWNVTNGISEVTIPPGIEVSFYDDSSPTTAYVSVGEKPGEKPDWKTVANKFMNHSKVNSRLDHEPRSYLKYSGRDGTMRLDTDLDREYAAEGSEPRSLDTQKVTEQISAFIVALADRLGKLPSADGFDEIGEDGFDANLRRVYTEESIPAPEDFPVLYTWVDYRDAHRIAAAEYPDAFDNRDGKDGMYGLDGNGMRLVALGYRDDKGQFPERAWDGFEYASADPSVKASQWIYPVKSDSMPVEVRLKWLNEVYVVDAAAARHAKEAAHAEAEFNGRKRIGDRALDSISCAVARTMVPAANYKGGYEEPMYLIGRQTGFDEVRLMAGRVAIVYEGNTVRTTMTDKKSGIEIPVYEPGDVCPWHVREANRAAERIVSFFGGDASNVKQIGSPPKPELVDVSADTDEAAAPSI